jgi:energy-coupling factor transporter ATP-binding protein EcfA2
MPPVPSQTPYLKRIRLRNMPPLLDVQATFQPGLTIIIGKPGTGKSSILRALEELVDLSAYKYEGAGSELSLGDRRPLTISFKQDFRSLAHYEKQFSARAINREAFETLVALLPKKRNGQSPLLMVVAKGKKTADNYTINAALQELGGYSGSLYTLKTLGAEVPPAQLLFIEKPATFKSSSIPLGNEQYREQLECIDAAYSFEDLLEHQLALALRGALPLELVGPVQTASQLSNFRLLVQQAIGVHLNRLTGYLATYSSIQAVRLSEQLRVYRAAKTGDLLVENVVLEYQLGSEWLSFNALTDATKRIFYLIAEISATASSPYGALAGTEEYHKLILLDQPTLGLPMVEQQQAFRFLHATAQTHQLLVATDAPQALDVLTTQELDHIYICSFTSEQGTQLRQLSPIQQAEAGTHLSNSGLLSEWWDSAGL